MILFLLQVRRAESRMNNRSLEPRPLSSYTSARLFLNRCFIKGMGLILGVQCRRARFSIHYDPGEQLEPNVNLVIEIVGPNRSFCTENVTFDEETLKDRESERFMQNLILRATIRKKSTEVNLKIPFFVEKFVDHLLITYIPFFTGLFTFWRCTSFFQCSILLGEHRISICWQGQHVFESPYRATIEDTTYAGYDFTDVGPKCKVGYQYPLCLIDGFKTAKVDEMAMVVKKKTIRQVIVSNGEEHEYHSYFATSKIVCSCLFCLIFVFCK